jgi:hypothetical protein
MSESKESGSAPTEEGRSLTGGSTAPRAGAAGPSRASASMLTEGQALLRRLARKYTEKRIARRCGVCQPVVSRWISGKRKPNYENRKILFDEYQIPMDAWDRRIAHTP